MKMDKTKIRIVKRGDDNSNFEYWATLTPTEGLAELEDLRRGYNIWKYGAHSRLQRVYRVVKREQG